jgi:hypothetical protein
LIDKQRYGINEVEEYSYRVLVITICNIINIENKQGDLETIRKTIDSEYKAMVDDIVSRMTINHDSYRIVIDKLIDNKDYLIRSAISNIRYFSIVYNKKTNWHSFYKDRNSKLKSNIFEEQFQRILAGKVVYDLQHPQLIVLRMIKEKLDNVEIPFKAQIAAIQSFLQCYYRTSQDGKYNRTIIVKRK